MGTMVNMNDKVVQAVPGFAEHLAGEVEFVAIFVARWSAASQPLVRAVTAALLESSTPVVAVDVDTHPHFADQFAIVSVPTVVVLKGSDELRRFVGATNPVDIAESVGSARPVRSPLP